MAIETNGGTWVNVNSNDDKGHVNVYGSDPKKPHDESIHVNIDYNNSSFTINEKSNGVKTSTDCKCYLTTACMRHKTKNFDDNCEELTILRWFRDKFVSKEEIEHYYKTAPIIVSALNEFDNSDEIFDFIYENVVRVCVTAIKNGDYDFAYNRYKNSILTLEEQFARPMLEEKLIRVLKLEQCNKK